MSSPVKVKQEEEIPLGGTQKSESPTQAACAIQLEEKQCANIKIEDYKSYIKELRRNGQTMRSDKDQPKLIEKPTWFNEDLFKNAQSVYARHFMGINFAHLSGLLLLVRVDSIYRTLSATDKSSTVSKLFKRYYHTVRHVKCWYEGDIFDENDDAYKSLLIVRGMHNKVSSKFNDQSQDRNVDVDGVELEESHQCEVDNKLLNKDVGLVGNSQPSMVHISEYDIMVTQFAFVGFIVMKATNMGLLDDFSAKDMESLLHFWRLIGYYLGASDKYNLFSYEMKDIIGICEAIKEVEYKESMIKNSLSSPPGIMSLNIIRSIKFIPMLTIYGMMRYLYELLEQETTEIEHKSNWYSNLSYTLINIVMTRFLAYKPLRSFNNGLTRLSLFMVGKVEDWFSRRLESRYGQELKA